MKTLKPVDEETYAKIGKAYLICSEYPEVFGEVTMKQFCSMFVDVIDEDEDEREARMRAYAPKMYQLLRELKEYSEEYDLYSDLKDEVFELLRKIDGGETSDE